jgi:hypothetical protein
VDARATTPAPSSDSTTASRRAWHELEPAVRAALLSEISHIAVAGTSASRTPCERTDAAVLDSPAARCDRVLIVMADLLRTASVPRRRAMRSAQVVVDSGFPLERAVVSVAAALIVGETVTLGFVGGLDRASAAYVRSLAALLPGRVLRIRFGDRLVSGGHDRVSWLSPSCCAESSPPDLRILDQITSVLLADAPGRPAVGIEARGTSDPAPRRVGATG